MGASWLEITQGCNNVEEQVLPKLTIDTWSETPFRLSSANVRAEYLSVPELRGRVPRFKKLRVTALDRDGKPIEIVASDFHARVIQHETDHLKGEIYLDRMPDMRALGFLQEWQRYMIKLESKKD